MINMQAILDLFRMISRTARYLGDNETMSRADGYIMAITAEYAPAHSSEHGLH